MSPLCGSLWDMKARDIGMACRLLVLRVYNTLMGFPFMDSIHCRDSLEKAYLKRILSESFLMDELFGRLNLSTHRANVSIQYISTQMMGRTLQYALAYD